MTARVRGALLLGVVLVPAVALADQPEPVAPPAVVPIVPPGHAWDPRASSSGSAIIPDSVPPPAPVFAWQPFGYLRLQYIAVEDDPNVAFVGRDDGFELQNARIGVRGELSQFRTPVAFVVAFDGAVDEREQVNTPDGKLRVGLRDAFADVALGDRVVVRGGYFQALVDPEAMIGDTERELVDNPIESRGMRATEGYQTPGLPPGRSLGAAIRIATAGRWAGRGGSESTSLGFEIAVQNGADEFSSNNDNDKPAISATAVGRWRESWVMAAARYNPRTVGDLPFRQDENDVQTTAGLHLALGPAALGGGVVAQRTSYPTTGGPSQTAYGGHAQLLVTVPLGPPIQIGYRFGILDPSSLVTTDRVMEHAAAVVIGLPYYRMRVQLQLTHVVEQAARELSNDRVQLAAELAL